MKKRVLSFLLALVMLLTLLPATAMAAVRDQLNRTPEENEALLEELSALTGGSGEEAYAFLEQYGLLDEQGRLKTDCTVDLDGQSYSLAEAMALLENPDTDLTQIGWVDGTPIALGDLKTIIRIEQELSRIRETYFSGEVFTGEALDGLNSLLNQMETDGITLHSAEVPTSGPVLTINVSDLTELELGNSEEVLYNRSLSAPFCMEDGQTISLDAAYTPGVLNDYVKSLQVCVYANDYHALHGEPLACAALSREHPAGTLVYTHAGGNSQELVLAVQAETYGGYYTDRVEGLLFGPLSGLLKLSNAGGFFFLDGEAFRSGHQMTVTKHVPMEETATSWYQESYHDKGMADGISSDRLSFRFLPDVADSGQGNVANGTVERINRLITLLQKSRGEPVTADNAVTYRVGGTLFQVNDKGWTANASVIWERDLYPSTYDRHIFDVSGPGIILSGRPGDEGITGSPFCFTGWSEGENNAVPQQAHMTNVFSDYTRVPGNTDFNIYGLKTWLKDCTVELLRDGRSALLKSIEIPEGTYFPGDLIPVTMTFDELVRTDRAEVVVNGVSYTPEELKMTSFGNRIMFWYPVQMVDSTALTFSVANVTDYCGEGVRMAKPAPETGFEELTAIESARFPGAAQGVVLETAQLRYAAADMTAVYENLELTVSVELARNPEFRQLCSNYHTPDAGEAQEMPFQAVVLAPDGTEHTVLQVYNTPGGFATETYTVPRGISEQLWTVTLRANEGTRELPHWVDLPWLRGQFTTEPFIPAAQTVVSDADPRRELSLADPYRPTLTAEVFGADGVMKATCQTGVWSCSDPEIAGITPDGMVTLTGRKLGTVTFTYTADNGTQDPADDKAGVSQVYTVVGGDSPALVIPGGSSTIVARQNGPASVLWSSNAAAFVPGLDFVYTVEVFEGNFLSDSDLAGHTPKASYTADPTRNSVRIAPDVLTVLSVGDAPAYTVRVSMPHPSAQGGDVRLSALAWIVVYPMPASAQLQRPENGYLLDTQSTVDVSWRLEGCAAEGQQVTLTVLRIQEDGTSDEVCRETYRDTLSGSCTLSLLPVADSFLRDIYQVMLSASSAGTEAPSTDGYPLYVYNADAMKIVNKKDRAISSLTLQSDVEPLALPEDTDGIMAMRKDLRLFEEIGINYRDYRWDSFRDGIRWTSDSDDLVVSHKRGGLYEDIRNFSYDTYLPESKMGVSSVKDGTYSITATHAPTGMNVSIPVTASTLKDQLYIFQFQPAVKTTLRYRDSNARDVTVTSNDDGVLAIFEYGGIKSDIQVSSVKDGEEFIGTVYRKDLLSGERDAIRQLLYPINVYHLRSVGRTELTLIKPGGEPLANTRVTIRGGIYKNSNASSFDKADQDGLCQQAGIGPARDQLQLYGGQQYTTDQDGRLTIYLDPTQFWTEDHDETSDTPLKSADDLQYRLEISGIDGDRYYPVFHTVAGSVGVNERLRTAADVVLLEAVPQGENRKPFIAQQVVDYNLQNGRLIDVKLSTGRIGPNSSFRNMNLLTTVYMWGTDMEDVSDYSLRIAAEHDAVPMAQQDNTDIQPPYASIPAITHRLTISERGLNSDPWLPKDGTDLGLKLRLYHYNSQDRSRSLVQEREMPFRAVNLLHVPHVTEDERVSQMLVTMTNSSGWKDKAEGTIGQVGGSNILKMLNGKLEDLTGPIDSSVFKMLISPGSDPTVFHAMIWAGYNTLGLADIDYSQNGVALTGDLLKQNLEVGVPGLGDLSEMAQGTYAPLDDADTNSYQESLSSVDVKLQLEGFYEAEIRYNFDTSSWEVFTTGGGFTAGAGVGFSFAVNTYAGPVPLTATFGAGGAVQLSMKTAVRYAQQGTQADSLGWQDPNASAVNDFLTNLRLNAYVDAFGGIGFDYSVVALKFGVFGGITVDSNNSFLSRDYLADASQRQKNGQALTIGSEIGIKFVATFLFINYEAVLASGSVTGQQTFNNWNYIYNYWDKADSGLSAGLASVSAHNRMDLVSAKASLQNRGYLEDFARSWNDPAERAELMALDHPDKIQALQSNANPGSYPRVNNTGHTLAMITDQGSANIYDSRACTSSLFRGAYTQPVLFPDPQDFPGFGDSDVDISGGFDSSVAAWVRMGEVIPGKNAGDLVTAEEQNLLMNSTEIVASVRTGGSWETVRLTNNASPDLSPATAGDSSCATVFWRSVYNSGPSEEELLEFTAKDCIMYRQYRDGTWGETKMLYNGANGSVKALEAAALPDGTAMAVYTLDRGGRGNAADYEVGYTIVGADGTPGTSMLVTSDSWLDENPQADAIDMGSQGGRFVLAWHSVRDGSSDIRLLAVDSAGTMTAEMPASLSSVIRDGKAEVGADFRMSAAYGKDLYLTWTEMIPEQERAGMISVGHSVLRSAILRWNEGEFILSAPQELAELPMRTQADHFDTYYNMEQDSLNAVIQATRYSDTEVEHIGGTALPKEETVLYTASTVVPDFALEVERIAVDYGHLTPGQLAPVEFTIRNTGTYPIGEFPLQYIHVAMGEGETAVLEQMLLPNESASLTLLHRVGDPITDDAYTITALDGRLTAGGTVYLDYPDVGISRMEVIGENAGKRTVSMTLYNSSAAELAGGKGRSVKLALFSNDLLTEKANVTSSTPGVSVDGNLLTIDGEDALKRMDEGGFTLELTFDLGEYVRSGLKANEVPKSGVYLYADLWTEGTVGEQTSVQRLPEYSRQDNQTAVLMTGALARTGKAVTLEHDLRQTSYGNTQVTVHVRNNSLEMQPLVRLSAILKDSNNNVLETKPLTMKNQIPGETTASRTFSFSCSGSTVEIVLAREGEDKLTIAGGSYGDEFLITLEDFTEEDSTYTKDYFSGSLLVTAISGSGEPVSIDGTVYPAGIASQRIYVPIYRSSFTIKLGEKTYTLNMNPSSLRLPTMEYRDGKLYVSAERACLLVIASYGENGQMLTSQVHELEYDTVDRSFPFDRSMKAFIIEFDGEPIIDAFEIGDGPEAV